MEKEFWKEHPVYWGYWFSNIGNVWRDSYVDKAGHRLKEHFIQPRISNKQMVISVNQRPKSLSRLVFEAHTGKVLDSRARLQYRDSNHLNNNLTNLYEKPVGEQNIYIEKLRNSNVDEIWKHVSGLGREVRVSNLGSIQVKEAGIWVEKSTHINGSGYVRVSFVVDKKNKTFSVHRIVAHAFLGIDKSKDECDEYDVHHVNFNKKDNRLSNLEVMSHKENVREITLKNSEFSDVKFKRFVDDENGNRIRTVYSCPNCGGDMLSKTAKQCTTCSAKSYTSPNFEEEADVLFALLVKYPFTFVAELYGVTDNTVRKWCVRHTIPKLSSYYRNISVR